MAISNQCFQLSGNLLLIIRTFSTDKETPSLFSGVELIAPIKIVDEIVQFNRSAFIK